MFTTVDVLSYGAGIVLWSGGYGVPSYRIAILNMFNPTVVLYYCPGTASSTCIDPAEAYGVNAGTLRVQATSATRNIKVYFNNVLKIDFMETDTSRPNSGLAGFSAVLGSATVDNFMLEQ